MSEERDPLLQEREKTHGPFHRNALISQGLKETMEQYELNELDKVHIEALHMIAHKIGRILAGNPNFRDHWNDIAGYAKLAAEACKPQ